MDSQHAFNGLQTSNQLNSLLVYIIGTFFPVALPLVSRNPNLLRMFGCALVLWPIILGIGRLKSVWDQTSSHLVSEVHISEHEYLYQYVVDWLEPKKHIKLDNTVNAELLSQYQRERLRGTTTHDTIQHVRFRRTSGVEAFLFRRKLFVMRRSINIDPTSEVATKRLHLYCLSRSTQPQKDLLEEIYCQQAQEERDETAIYRPWGNEQSRWSCVTDKAVRPMDTVVLEDDQKIAILSDIEEYLKPETRDMYVSRGIPYRRGYLFSGPPGTGKTSLAMAIAGQFGLKIYMVSLFDIGDSDLMQLLQRLPSTGCLLLLEDIDSAGLDRKLRRQAKASTDSETPPEAEDEQQISKVTLSGLLNAIDGISSPEGHVLIMTTNTPEKMDSALIRSGRISVRVAFASATQSQAQDIFLRQYQTKDHRSDEDSKNVRKLVPAKRKLPAMAAAFAKKVPENEFTPADLQDYLITHKDEPQEAVDEFEEFKTRILEDRRHLKEEREAEMKMEREARATEASKQAEASAFAMAKAMSAVSSSLAGSSWGGMRFW